MNTLILRHERFTGILISFFAHAALLVLGSFLVSQPIEYAVDFGSGGVEIDLTAAPTEEPSTEAPAPAVQDEMPEAASAVAQPRESQTRTEPLEGKDKVTFHSPGGALTDAKPDYLRNRAPAYPLEARQKNQEGLVVLRVAVGHDGWVKNIRVDDPSGHELLDASALSAVRKWRFLPAKTGGIPVESEVLVPVRFSLKD